jgi:Glycosyltransferase 61
MSSPESIKAAAHRYQYLAQQYRSGTMPAELRVFRGRTIYPPNAGKLELDNAEVLSGEWAVIANDAAYLDGFVQTPLPPLSAYVIEFAQFGVELLHEPAVELSAPEAFLLGGCGNYCLWLMDFLPRLQQYRFDGLPLLTNQPLRRFQIQSLQLLGIEPSSLIELDYPGTWRVRKLHYPCTRSSFSTPPLTFDPAIIGWLHDVFGRFFAPVPPHRKIFISRAAQAHARSRRLVNEDVIIGVAEKNGFEVVRCEELSFEDQIRLFSQAAVIAGPHGAGFTNMVFAPKCTKIIELLGPRFSRDATRSRSFVKLAALLQQQFVRIVGSSDEQSAIEMNHLVYETYTIDPDDFLRALRD